MSKAAASALLRNLACELAPKGVRVNEVAPTFIYSDSEISQPSDLSKEDFDNLMRVVGQAHPPGRAVYPHEIADVLAWLCSDQSTYVTGNVIHMDGARRLVCAGGEASGQGDSTAKDGSRDPWYNESRQGFDGDRNNRRISFGIRECMWFVQEWRCTRPSTVEYRTDSFIQLQTPDW